MWSCGITGEISISPFFMKGFTVLRLLPICAALLLLPVTAPAGTPPLELTLRDAVRMAAERNLDVRAELYNPAQYEADINRSRAIYDPLFKGDAGYSDTRSPTVSVNSPVTVSGEALQLSSSLSQLFWSGGTASLSFSAPFNNTSVADYWRPGLGITLEQPLLKNAGREVTEAGITISRLSKFASLEKFNSKLQSIVAQVRTEYFRLYSLREQVQVKNVSLGLARKILDETRARVAAGVLPAMEILNAEFGTVSREKELIDAEKAVSDQVDVLRVLLQLEGGRELITADSPGREKLTVDEADLLKRALNRQDIRELKRNLEIAELQSRVNDNRIRPDLVLSAATSLTGQDSSLLRSMEKMASFDNPAWSLGLTMTYPIGNNAAENDYRKSRLKLEQVALQIRVVEESALNEVRSAVRGVVTGFKQIDVADRGRTFAEERLRAFIKKNEVGLATTKDVLDVENDLAAAKSSQISAVVDYNNAITRLWLVSGTLLEREGIHIVESTADRLYTRVR